MEQDINTQSQPEATLPAAEPNAAELQAQLEEMKKQSEGRLRDLQQERAKRQELEARFSSPAPSAAAPNPDVTEDELAKVLKPYIAPVAKQAAEAQAELQNLRTEKAQKFLESKTGKTWDAIEADRDFQDRLHQVIRKYGIAGNVYDMTVRAYELIELENLKTKEVERERASKASSAASLPSGTGRVSSSASAKKYTAEEFSKLPTYEFDKYTWRKLPDGSFESTPR